MNTSQPLLSRRHLLGALAAAAAATTSLPALALGRLTDIRVIDRDRDEVLPLYTYRGELWTAGEPGGRYAIELRNDSRERLLNVVSVDGINVITGETAAFDQAGYVLEPGQRYDVAGWRKSRKEIAAFEFTRLSRSYAARTGRPDDVGVIGVAVFRERIYRADPSIAPYDRSAPVPRSGPPAMDRKSASGAGPQLGTGHGERERDRVGTTEFERRSRRPDEIIRVRYDSRENLIAMGVIPTRRRHEHRPSAFPGARNGYVPDPD